MTNRQQFFGSAFIVMIMACTGVPVLAGNEISDIDSHRSCTYCGMDRKAYGFSRMLIEYHDGTSAGVCSLHCAVIELDSHKDRTIKALLVADREDRQLIPAESAVWVMGGRKPGVMTRLPKWAFRSETSAKAFIAQHGGSIARWEEAVASARKELAAAPQ